MNEQQYREAIRQLSPVAQPVLGSEAEEVAHGELLIAKAHAAFGAEADRDAWLAQRGLAYGVAAPPGWSASGAGGLPPVPQIPLNASTECIECVLAAWSALLATWAASNLLTEPSRSALREHALIVFDAAIAKCPCSGEW